MLPVGQTVSESHTALAQHGTFKSLTVYLKCLLRIWTERLGLQRIFDLFEYLHKYLVSGCQNDIRIRPYDTAHAQFVGEIRRMSTRKRTSPVWEFFELMEVAINEKKFKAAICKLCEGVSLAYGGGASNLLNHLEAKDPVAYV